MDAPEDFVVVEDAVNAQKTALNKLNVLIDLFRNAIDTVNQSSALLRDEVGSALAVTLEHSSPDFSVSTQDIVSRLQTTVSESEDVRANYTRHLCSHMVTVNEEKTAALDEVRTLKETIATMERECSEKLANAAHGLDNLNAAIFRLEGEPNPSETTGLQLGSIEELCTNLNNLSARLAKVQLNKASGDALPDTPALTCTEEQTVPVQTVTDSPTQSEESETREDGVQAAPLSSSVSIQHDAPEELAVPNPPSTETAWAGSEEERGSPIVGATRSDPPPSYSAQEEEPWCPCCNLRFESRDELESHLPNCLE